MRKQIFGVEAKANRNSIRRNKAFRPCRQYMMHSQLRTYVKPNSHYFDYSEFNKNNLKKYHP